MSFSKWEEMQSSEQVEELNLEKNKDNSPVVTGEKEKDISRWVDVIVRGCGEKCLI